MSARARRRRLCRWQRYVHHVDRLAVAIGSVLDVWEGHLVVGSFLPEEARLAWEEVDEQFKAVYDAFGALLASTAAMRDGLPAEARHAPVM